MQKKTKLILFWIVGGLVIVGVTVWFANLPSVSGKYDAFAECLEERGAIFYGAFWCSHCKNQKAMFGKSQKLIPYIECSTPDGRGQLEICREKNITGYPTWEFADESRISGEISLEVLSDKTECQLPE